ncbi:hypothetical protein Poli38472_000957 [Pythium oligandrum]|uniref:GB1/RHD3-type G domain-containing protein n=1 Tax=Pythium oligandrum TaxID=41045 RepID=A0A8K1FEU3_PYTOL|nr:hypothetical protein Poli38472_000957 [Pythium oligandrum]|eukprot:TMW60915.1 hypothetical protein Poli38472_000957 [Pythium oligandrum]
MASMPSMPSPPALHAPIPFVMLSEDNTFEVADEALAFLQQIQGPIAVVAIAGLYRTGKSYLLNLLLGRDHADAMFHVGATVNACTKGIWLWGQPLTQVDRGLQDELAHLTPNTTVVFMDTEGLGSTDRSQTQDTRIFALALLLSSLFIYNSRGVIDSNAIEDLSLVVHLTKYIQAKAQSVVTNGDASDGSELAAFFPDFLWVVRDFTLQLQEEGRTVTPKDYFESALKPQPATNDEVVAKNKIRAMLSTFFPNRDCVTMVRPLNDENLLRQLIHQPYESLRPEFREQMEILKQKVFTSLQPKRMMANTLNGGMLATLAQSYVDAFNSGASPVITSVWDRVIEDQCGQALEAAKKTFESVFTAQVAERSGSVEVSGTSHTVPLEDKDVYEIFEHAEKAANGELAREEIQSSGAMEQYALQLSEFMLTFLQDALEKNDKKSREFNQALLKELYQPPEYDFLDLNEPASSDGGDTDGTRLLRTKLSESRSLMEAAVTKYHERSAGPAKSAVLVDFLADKLVQGLIEWGSLVKSVFRSKEEQTESQIATAKQTLRTLEGKVKASQEVLSQQKESYERALQAIAERLTDERVTLRQEIESKQAEIDRAHLQVERLAVLHKEAIDRLDAQLEEAKQDRKRLEDAQQDVATRRQNARMESRSQLLESERNFHQEEKDLLQNQQQLLQKVVDLERQLGEQDTDHMKEIFRLEKDGQSKLSDLRLQYQDEQETLKEQTIQDIRKAKDQHDEELSALQDQLNEKKALLASLRERLETKEAMAMMKKNKRNTTLNGGGNEDCVLQ